MLRQTKQSARTKTEREKARKKESKTQLEKAAALVMDSSLVPGLGLSRNTSVL